MIEGGVEIEWHGVAMGLLPDRAVWLPGERAVLVADVHLGKPASFRSMGVPVPEGLTPVDLSRMSVLVRATGAERLIVLGDLIHDAAALRDRTREAVLAWRRSLADVAVELIPGNHDRKARSCEALGVSVLDESVEVGGLVLTHEPPAEDVAPTLCGHVHPAVSIGPIGSPARVRSACFWFGGMTGILPAFGSFTGGRAIPIGAGAGVFAAGDREVVPVTKLAARWAADRTGAPTCDSAADWAGSAESKGGPEAYDRA